MVNKGINLVNEGKCEHGEQVVNMWNMVNKGNAINGENVVNMGKRDNSKEMW